MFFKKKKKPVEKADYDRVNERPVIRASICNGEQVAGFKNIRTGAFRDVMLLRSREDKEMFLEMYGLHATDVKTEY